MIKNDMPDIFIIGMQRIVNFNAKNLIFSSTQNESVANNLELLIYDEISKTDKYQSLNH